MKLDAEQIRGIVELREKLQERLEQLRQEVEMTTLNIDALDTVLTQSSFTRASQYKPPDTLPPEDTDLQPKSVPPPPSNDDAEPIIVNDATIGGITKSNDSISIMLHVPVSIQTQPFKSFFLERIIGGMIKKDTIEAENERLPKDSVMRYELKTQGDTLSHIIIYNYRLEERAREITSTIRWTLSRMLEHVR